MTVVADEYPFVVGVDTHTGKHVYTILDSAAGALVDSQSFPTTSAGINRALTWVTRRTQPDKAPLWVIEGTASYGAILTSKLISSGHSVAEAPRLPSTQRYGIGKSDELDSRRFAYAVLALETDKLNRPRLGNGVRQAIRVLVTARESMTGERTRCVNALHGLLRSNDLGVDVRHSLSKTQIAAIALWRVRKEELSLAVARREAIRLAKHAIALGEQIAENEKQITDLVAVSEAAPLLEQTGFGAISAAKCLIAWSHYGRVRTETQFASLAGVNPIPASSGNTVRHRLNHGGDRGLNSALHMVAMVKMVHDDRTRAYVKKRQAQGKTTREIRRCLKRYIARRVFRILNKQHRLQTT